MPSGGFCTAICGKTAQNWSRWTCPAALFCSVQKIFSSFLQFILDFLPLGTKIPVEAAFFRLSGDKNKKATLSRGRYNGSQRSLMICLVLPKIMSSTSCLMKFSNIFVFTLLSFIYFSLYYKRGKGKFQSSALMALPKKLAAFSCKLLYLHLHFRYSPLIIK